MPQNGNAKQTLTKNKIQNPNCWGGWREGDHCVLLLEIQLGTTITTWSPLLSKSTAGLVDRLTRPLFREWNRGTEISTCCSYLQPHAHCWVCHSTYDVERMCLLMYTWIKFATYLQWSVIQTLKRIQSCYLPQ